MPNRANVERPISLIGLGRSGTTVLQAAFGRHPHVQVCGETFGMIAAMWSGSMVSYLNNDFTNLENLGLKQPEKAPHYIRACMCALCRGDKPFWFHKPIGLPKFLNWNLLPGEKSPINGFPTSWYWQILSEAFPQSTYITTVRSPWDVVLSRREHSGWDMQGMIRDVEFTYEMYELGKDQIKRVIFFEDMVENPEAVLKDLCELTGLDFRPGMLKAFEKSHAPVEGRGPKKDHRELWKDLAGLKIRQSSLDRIAAFWRAHGKDFEVPDGLSIE